MPFRMGANCKSSAEESWGSPLGAVLWPQEPPGSLYSRARRTCPRATSPTRPNIMASKRSSRDGGGHGEEERHVQAHTRSHGGEPMVRCRGGLRDPPGRGHGRRGVYRSEEHTSELQSQFHL